MFIFCSCAALAYQLHDVLTNNLSYSHVVSTEYLSYLTRRIFCNWQDLAQHRQHFHVMNNIREKELCHKCSPLLDFN